MKYNIWESLVIYQHVIDFDILEKNILLFDKMKKQGVLKDGIEKAMNENKYSILATFKGKKKVHKLVLIGIRIEGMKNKKYGLIDIYSDDIEIDGESIFSKNYKCVDVI